MSALVPVWIHPSQFPDACERECRDGLILRRIAPKFHYGSPKQSQAWLALHRACSPAQSDPQCQRIYDACFQFVASQLPDQPVHLAGLGCGSADKEARLLQALDPTHRSTHVTLADGSPGLMVGAYQTVRALPGLSGVTALVLDLTTISDLEATLFADPRPDAARLITCFGVLPNAEPSVLLPKLRGLLRPRDWLLVSANLRADGDPLETMRPILPLYDNSLTRDWLMLFLLDCGFERGDGVIGFSVESSPEADGSLEIVASFDLHRDRTLALGCEPLVFRAGDRIRLFSSNRFTGAQIQSLLEAHGLHVEHASITPNREEGVFACRG